MNRILFFLIFLIFNAFALQAQAPQKKITRAEYIATYKDDAIREMLKSGVPASITLAQGILESGDGNSLLAVKAKNHFGIKCHSDWTGKSMRLDDDEKNECFRKYNTAYESFSDHSLFLTTRNRYAFLFDLQTTDYKGWAKGLKKAGYATNPKYAQLLIELIEKHKLYQYDEHKKAPDLKENKPLEASTKQQIFQTIKLHNNIKYIKAKAGDTFYSIANKYEMNLWQVLKYNDLQESDAISPGDMIYLQPKRNKCRQAFHLVKKDETMRDISQQYGVKLKKLYKYNLLSVGAEPKVGDKILLRKEKQLF